MRTAPTTFFFNLAGVVLYIQSASLLLATDCADGDGAGDLVATGGPGHHHRSHPLHHLPLTAATRCVVNSSDAVVVVRSSARTPIRLFLCNHTKTYLGVRVSPLPSSIGSVVCVWRGL